MKYTLESLMKQVGCSDWPRRWETIFEDAMIEYDTIGCPQTNPAYYDELEKQIGCMGTYLDLYKKAAMLTAQDDALSRFLSLLVLALRDQDNRDSDIAKLSLLTPPPEKDPLAYNMITGLAVCSQINEAYERLKTMNIPDQYLYPTLKEAVHGGVNHYMRIHNGRPGFELLGWAQYAINGRTFIIDRLEVEIGCTFTSKAYVFENKQGEQIALANNIRLHKSGFTLGANHFEDEEGAWDAQIEETSDYWEGYPYLPSGYVSLEKIRLYKKEWTSILVGGEPALGLHIPHRTIGPLTQESVDQSLNAIKAFVQEVFPDVHYKAFICYSWLMDPQVQKLVGEDSNIANFNRRFHPITWDSAGTAVFGFIFNQPDMNFRLEDLPENTRLEKSLKNHYLSGKTIYELFGYFTW